MISDRWRLLAMANIGTVAALAAADALESHGVRVVKVDRSETPEYRDIHLVEPPKPTIAPRQGERERARRRRQMAKKES